MFTVDCMVKVMTVAWKCSLEGSYSLILNKERLYTKGQHWRHEKHNTVLLLLRSCHVKKLYRTTFDLVFGLIKQ